jgi:diguanylate cyclase (GGDEF)-like protein
MYRASTSLLPTIADKGNKEGGVMSRDLPERANLEHLRKQAKRLLRDYRQGKTAAVEQLRSLAPVGASGQPKLADAQHAVAREYGFVGWPKIKQHVESLAERSSAVEVPVTTIKADPMVEYGATVESHLSKLFEELEPLAQLRITKALEKLIVQRDSRLGSTRSQLAARGLADSGMWVASLLDIHVGFLDQLCRQISDIWTELISEKGQRLSAEAVAFITQKIETVLMNKAGQIIDSSKGAGSIMQGTWALQDAERRISRLRAELRRDLEIRRKEEELFTPQRSDREPVDDGVQDDLLPLYRKRQFETDLPKILSEASGYAPVSLLFLDLDYFKQVNDRLGHLVGNEVLLGVASAVKAICAAKGRCYRWGGEELAVLLPNYTCAEAQSLAERIRHGVSKLEFENYPDKMTVSVGVASYPETSTTRERLVDDADNAMYQAKEKGRDQVRAATTGSPRPRKTPDTSSHEVPISPQRSTLTERPKRGRRTIPDNFLLGARNAWVSLLEESWAEIGWSLLRIRDNPSSTIEDVRNAVEPMKKNPHNSGLGAALYRETSETATASDIRKNRDRLGKLHAQILHTQAKHDELERSCHEAENALKVASPGDGAAIREEVLLRQQRLGQLGDDLNKVRAEAEALDKRLQDQESYVSRSELLDFLRFGKYAVTPRNLANALAGLPEMRWKQSSKRCSGMEFNQAMLHYRVFEVMSEICSHLRQGIEAPPVESFRTELLRRSKRPDYSRQFLRENWRDMKLAIEECWKENHPSAAIPFVLTSIFMRATMRQKDAAERILAEREKLEP